MRPARTALAAGVFLSMGIMAEAAERPQTAAAPEVADNDPHWPVDTHAQCAAFDAHAGIGDTIHWTGACRDGKASGPGTLTFSAHGRMFQQLTGVFDGGMVQDGRVTIVWADGSKYEGEERHGRFNGAGVLTTADGGRYDGVWENDSFQGPRQAATPATPTPPQLPARVAPPPTPAPTKTVSAPVVPTPKPPAPAIMPRRVAAIAAPERVASHPRPRTNAVSGASADASNPEPAPAPQSPSPPPPQDASADNAAQSADAPPTGRWSFLGGIMDANLVAVDGSTLMLGSTDGGGMVRAIARPDGSAQNVNFVFLGDRLGTVRDPRAPDAVLATFRISNGRLDIDYADGHSERIAPNGAGGVVVTTTAPGGQIYETAWYPEGHSFSRADRDAAVAQFASRLSASAPTDTSPPSAVPVAAPAPATHATKPKKHSSPRSAHAQTSVAQATPPPAPMPAPPLPAGRVAMLGASEPVVVRTSEIHPIDPPDVQHGASSCLTVESDGKHWGFRNRCDSDVQFVYCLLDGSNPLADCTQGGVSGSVAANGFGALTADESLKDVAANHAFRWVACAGGAGEVVARLDRADPPTGRCLRASEQGPQEADASNGE